MDADGVYSFCVKFDKSRQDGRKKEAGMVRRFEMKMERMRVGKVVSGSGEKRLLFENVMDVLEALVTVGKEFRVTIVLKII